LHIKEYKMPIGKKEARLEQLAQVVKDRLQNAEKFIRSSIEETIEAGEALIEARELVGHGGWRRWVKDACRISKTQAAKYMDIARGEEYGVDVRKARGIEEAYGMVRRAKSQQPEPAATKPFAPEKAEDAYDFTDEDFEDESLEEQLLDPRLRPSEREALKKKIEEREAAKKAAPESPAPRERDPLMPVYNAIDKALKGIEGEELARRMKLIQEHLDLHAGTVVEPSRKRKHAEPEEQPIAATWPAGAFPN
jgi:hypothetical protein